MFRRRDFVSTARLCLRSGDAMIHYVWQSSIKPKGTARKLNMRRVKTAVIGAGFMGKVHAEAIRRLGVVDLVAVAGVSDDEARRFGASIGVEKTYGDYKALIADPEIEAVHVCTPN